MTDADLDRELRAHWRQSEATLKWVKLLIGVFGVAALGALFMAGVQWRSVEINAEKIAAVAARIEAQDVRMRVVEQSERAISATLSSQAETLRDIRADQRAIRDLLNQYLRDIPPRRGWDRDGAE